jgi:hypothetical protein
MTSVAVKNVSLSFGSIEVLKSLDIDIPQGIAAGAVKG